MHVIFDALKTILNGYENYFVKKIKKSRGNWEQNDPEADDYIKNRTHWKEEKNIVALPEQEITVSSSLNKVIPSSLTLVEGETYTVTFNGAQYKCVAYYFDDWGAVCIGNPRILKSDSSITAGNNEPFVLDSYSNGDIFLNVAEQGTYTISIQKKDVIYHQLDPKFIPEDAVVGKQYINEQIQDAIDRLGDLAFKNYLTAADVGAVTEQDVQAMINGALGVIENGTY